MTCCHTSSNLSTPTIGRRSALRAGRSSSVKPTKAPPSCCSKRTAFTRDARGLAVGPAAVVHLADRYGSSLHAAFRRYAETHHQPVLVIRLHAVRNSDGSYTRHEQPCSPGWSKRFGRPSCPRQLQPAQYPFLAAIDNPVDQVIVHDINGEPVQVSVKAFDNTYSHFLLLWVPAAHKLLRPKAVRLR